MSTMVAARLSDHHASSAQLSTSPRQRRTRRPSSQPESQQGHGGGDEQQQETTSNSVGSGAHGLAAASSFLHSQNSRNEDDVADANRSTVTSSLEIEGARSLHSATTGTLSSGKTRNNYHRPSWFPLGRRYRHQSAKANAGGSESALNTSNDVFEGQYVGGRMEADGVMKQPQHYFKSSSSGSNSKVVTATGAAVVDCPPSNSDAIQSTLAPNLPLLPPSHIHHRQQQQHDTPRTMNPFERVAPSSWMFGGQQQTHTVERDHDDDDEDGDSLRDFDASEWTPPDSSYGAAIPVAGWIPKSLRRSMEWTIIAAIAAIIVILIVRTSLKNGGGSGGSGSKLFHSKYVNNTSDTITVENVADYTTTPDDDLYLNDDAFYQAAGGADNEEAVVNDDAAVNDDAMVESDDKA